MVRKFGGLGTAAVNGRSQIPDCRTVNSPILSHDETMQVVTRAAGTESATEVELQHTDALIAQMKSQVEAAREAVATAEAEAGELRVQKTERAAKLSGLQERLESVSLETTSLKEALAEQEVRTLCRT
jgi:predicted nuclease with TOPRIM domain